MVIADEACDLSKCVLAWDVGDNIFETYLFLEDVIVHAHTFMCAHARTHTHTHTHTHTLGSPLATSITPTLLVAGSTFSLTCNLLYNYPTSTVSWARVDGTPLSLGRFIVSIDGVLTLSPVQAEDEGEYLCTAINSYGESAVRSNVTVHGM